MCKNENKQRCVRERNESHKHSRAVPPPLPLPFSVSLCLSFSPLSTCLWLRQKKRGDSKEKGGRHRERQTERPRDSEIEREEQEKQKPRVRHHKRHDASLFSRRAYVLVAWIWSIIWYLPLDPIKWVIAYALNEEGVRDRGLFTKQQEAGRMEAAAANQSEHQATVLGSVGRASWTNPLGRASLRVPTTEQLERASLALVSVHAAPP